IVDEYFRARVFELRGHIHGFCPRFTVDVKGLFHVWRNTVEYWAGLDRDIHVRNIADLRGGVRFREDGFAQVSSNLLLVDLESSDEGNVLHLVRSETGMHETGCETVLGRWVRPVVLYALYEGAGAVSHPGECDLDLSHLRNDSY